VKTSNVAGAASLYSVPRELIDPRDPEKVNRFGKIDYNDGRTEGVIFALERKTDKRLYN
jgi:hypothetical protein